MANEVTIHQNAVSHDAQVGQAYSVPEDDGGVAIECGFTPSYMIASDGDAGIIVFWQEFMGSSFIACDRGIFVVDSTQNMRPACHEIDTLATGAAAALSGETGAASGFILDQGIAPADSYTNVVFYR